MKSNICLCFKAHWLDKDGFPPSPHRLDGYLFMFSIFLDSLSTLNTEEEPKIIHFFFILLFDNVLLTNILLQCSELKDYSFHKKYCIFHFSLQLILVP